MSNPVNDVRLLRFRELRRIVPLSRSTIWRKIQAGEFPAPIRIGKSAVAWISSEVDNWIAEQVASRERKG